MSAGSVKDIARRQRKTLYDGNIREMWNLLVSWAVVAVLAPLAFTAGVSVLSMTPPEFRTARRWFWVSALLVLARTGAWVAGGLTPPA